MAEYCPTQKTIWDTGTPGGRYDKAKGAFVPAVVENPKAKPHGRLAWSIQLGAGAYIDISVTPRQNKE